MPVLPYPSTDPTQAQAAQNAEKDRRLLELERDIVLRRYVLGKMSRISGSSQVLGVAGATSNVDFTGADYDTDASVDLANDRLVAPVDGIYLVTGAIWMGIAAASALPQTGTVTMRLNTTGSGRSFAGGVQDAPRDSDTINFLTGATQPSKGVFVVPLPMMAGDYVYATASGSVASMVVLAQGTLGGTSSQNTNLAFQRVGLIPPGAIVY